MPPPASNDTCTTFCFPKRQRWDAHRMWAYELDLWPWRSWCLWLVLVVVLHLYTKLKSVGLAIRKIWRTMCVSINGPGDLDLWLFDLETAMLVATKVENLPFKFRHARSFGSRVIRYVCDGRTDRGRTKATLIAPFPIGRGHQVTVITDTSMAWLIYGRDLSEHADKLFIIA